MLIDLGRNDVGRVGEVGSVSLTESMVIERYTHVMHMCLMSPAALERGCRQLTLCALHYRRGL